MRCHSGSVTFTESVAPVFSSCRVATSLMLPSSIAVGLFFGYQLDKLLNTHPWMLLIFLLLGIASGFISLFRGIRKFSPPADPPKKD